MKKNLLLLAVISSVLAAAFSCKKEITLPSKETHHISDTPVSDTPVVYSNFPTNYLQPGNYWVYDNGDSVSVDSFIVKGEADTFYLMVHHYSNNYIWKEFRRITDEGLLVDTYGRIIFDFSGLPEVTDSSARSVMKCGTDWGLPKWSTTTTITHTECCYLTGKWLNRHGSRYAMSLSCPEHCELDEGYLLVRGVGIAEYRW